MIRYSLIIIVTFCSCTHTDQTHRCDNTRDQFIECLQNKEFSEIPYLFKAGVKSEREFQRLKGNLAYMRRAIGPVRSHSILKESNNLVVTKVDHQESSLEISFKFNDQCEILAMQVKTHYPENLPAIKRNETILSLPFTGEWYVQWGGSAIRDNYHNAHRNMKGAIDFTKRDTHGNTYRNNGRNNEDYYAFGAEIIAPCPGRVVRAVNDIPDNNWPEINQEGLYGNMVVLETANHEYILLGHLQQGSVVVEEGQLVHRGELLGLCGNSGYSKAPHLHFNVQNTNNLFHSTGADCFFQDILVNGEYKKEHLPFRGETVTNSNEREAI